MENMENNIIGERIKYLRQKNSMTQHELADLVNITYTSVSYWERGLSKPDIYQIKIIANYFGVPIDYIYGNENRNIKNNSKSKEDVELSLLFRKAENLNQEKKKKLNSIIKASINALWDDDF